VSIGDSDEVLASSLQTSLPPFGFFVAIAACASLVGVIMVIKRRSLTYSNEGLVTNVQVGQ
jgi:hypothetical protein